MKFQVSFLTIGALAALPAVAHHSFNAEYDRDSPISLTGVVTKDVIGVRHALAAVRHSNRLHIYRKAANHGFNQTHPA